MKISPQKPQGEASCTRWGQAEGMGGPHLFEDHTQVPALLLFDQQYHAIGLKILFPPDVAPFISDGLSSSLVL